MQKDTYPRNTQKKLLALFLATILFFFLTWLLSIVLPGGNTLSIAVESDHQDLIQFYWWNGKNPNGFSEKNSSQKKTLEPNCKQEIRVKAFDQPLNRLRIDPGNHPGKVKIYSLTLTSHYAAPVTYSAEELYRIFIPGRADVRMELTDEALVITSKQNDPFILSLGKLQKNSIFFRYILPLIFSILLYTFLVRSPFKYTAFAPFHDIDTKAPSSGSNINGLDGLRGLAALTVVADHTWGVFKGTGASGVLIFFSLSGFLLAPSFIRDSSRALSWNYMSNFFMRRIRRILPMYYLVIFIYFCIDPHWNIAIRHFLFIQGTNHFWAIPQEIFFYLLIPGFVSVIHLFCRKCLPLILSFLLISILLSNQFLDQDILYLYGMLHQRLRAFIGIFLGGMFFSYLYFSTSFQSILTGEKSAIIQQSTNIVGLFILPVLIFLSNSQLWGGSAVYAQLHFGIYGFLAATLVFCVAVTRKTLLDRLMSMRWLRGLGVVSLSFYLIHPAIMEIIRDFCMQYAGISLTDAPLFVITVIISYSLSCLTYTAVEKPFHKRTTI